MRKENIIVLLSAVAAAFLLSGCKGKELLPSGKEETKAYGISSNMRYNGQTEGNEQVSYFVWQDQLWYRNTGEQNSTVLEKQGASYLCLTEDTLYYRSEDGDGKPGIYARKTEQITEDRTLIYEGSIRYLYAVGDWLYFIEYPDSASLCRIRKDGTDFTCLLAGTYDQLIADGEYLYYRDYSTLEYFRVPLQEIEEDWVAECLFIEAGEDMPILEDGWLYFSKGESYTSYRMKLEDKTIEKLNFSIEQALVKGQKVYRSMNRMDMETGESSQWTEDYDISLAGFCGERMMFRQGIYTENDRMEYYAVPERELLHTYDLSAGGEDEGIEHVIQTTLEKQEAAALYRRFLQGELSLLKNKGEGITAQMCGENRKELTCYLSDLDGDGTEELFLKIRGNTWLLHAEGDGIYCWGSDFLQQGVSIEPLSDGRLLEILRYDQAPLHNESYSIYSVEGGGRRTREAAYQHVTLDTDDMEIAAEYDTLVPKEQYWLQDEEVQKKVWEEAVSESVEKLLTAETEWKTGLQK